MQSIMIQRFSPEQSKDRSNVAFLPFGEGPRNCIGLRFGMMQIRVALATLLMSFKITKCSKTILPMNYNPKSFILSPDGGMWAKLEKI